MDIEQAIDIIALLKRSIDQIQEEHGNEVCQLKERIAELEAENIHLRARLSAKDMTAKAQTEAEASMARIEKGEK